MGELQKCYASNCRCIAPKEVPSYVYRHKAQLAERPPDKREAGGSSPPMPINHKPLEWRIPRYLCMVRKSCSIQG